MSLAPLKALSSIENNNKQQQINNHKKKRELMLHKVTEKI